MYIKLEYIESDQESMISKQTATTIYEMNT